MVRLCVAVVGGNRRDIVINTGKTASVSEVINGLCRHTELIAKQMSPSPPLPFEQHMSQDGIVEVACEGCKENYTFGELSMCCMCAEPRALCHICENGTTATNATGPFV